MRLRNIPAAKGFLESHPNVIHDPFSYKGKWHNTFSDNKPIFLEIGCGKGRFLTELAMKNPDSLYIGIELYASVLYRAVQRFCDNPLDNLYFINQNAKDLADYFSEEEVDGIYLNFSDPWPKKRHSHRRLTSSFFLNIYSMILKRGGLIEFKTDNIDLFDFSLESFNTSDHFEIISYTKDLYNTPDMLINNIATEYEEKFHSYGNNICKLISRLI